MKLSNIRNFAIIAHIDHGKSTLSDKIIQMCGGSGRGRGLSNHEKSSKYQILDSMELERERGITIKAQSVTLYYKSINSELYQLNLIDTPGHVDFAYEVSRSLAACEGALLIVDAKQGVEAQTIANYYTAVEQNLVVVPIINKIDLPTANYNRVTNEIQTILQGIDTHDLVCCSAKTGIGIKDVIECLIKKIPPPNGDPLLPLQALVIDSWFDNYLGVIAIVRIKNGTINKYDKIKFMSSGQIYEVNRLGYFNPKISDQPKLNCGEVGWIVCNIKNIYGAKVGDTLTGAFRPAKLALPGFKKIQPQVYASLFPIRSKDYSIFCDALAKLSLNDTSLYYEPESSSALGFGFRCGFLGLLHMDIIHERLEREYNLNIISTAPTVVYEVKLKNNNIIYVDSPAKFPEYNNIKELREPIAKCKIFSPKEYLGKIISLCVEKRGVQTDLSYHGNQVALTYDIPMAEVVLDLFNRLKSISHGYASLTYSFIRFQLSDLVRIDIIINRERVDALTLITHRMKAQYCSRELVNKIKSIIPRHQFDIIIQAVIRTHVIASSTVKSFRKNVLSKCHGGDVSRKKKLLNKQKEGKKRMKKIGNVELPQEVFLAIFHIHTENQPKF